MSAYPPGFDVSSKVRSFRRANGSSLIEFQAGPFP